MPQHSSFRHQCPVFRGEFIELFVLFPSQLVMFLTKHVPLIFEIGQFRPRLHFLRWGHLAALKQFVLKIVDLL